MDDRHIKGPHDGRHINIHEEYEVRYWTHALGISKEQLEEAIRLTKTTASEDIKAFVWDMKQNEWKE